MKRQSIYYLFICVLTMGFASCVSEQFTPDTLPAGMKALTLTIQTADDSAENQSMGVRAGKTALGEDKLNENKIDHFEVFVFNADGSFNWRVEADRITRTEPENNTFSLSILVKEAEASNYEGKAFQICVVANFTQDLLNKLNEPSLSELRKVIQENDLNTGKAQPQFLMDGLVETQTIHWGDNKVFKVEKSLELKRAAAKIRLRIPKIEVIHDGNTQQFIGNGEVKLVHYTNKSSLVQGGAPYVVQEAEWLTTEYQKIEHILFPDENKYYTTTVPYYAYENNWITDGKKETYLILKLYLDDGTGTGNSAPYYYRIPVNYRLPVTGVDESELYQLKRNHLYDISATIEVLGSTDESEPVDIQSDIAIQPWVESDIIDGSINNIHYLLVKETTPTMPNIAYREVEYLSDLPIEITIDEVSYEVYNFDGKLERYVVKPDKPFIREKYIDSVFVSEEPITKEMEGATVTNNENDPQRKKLIIQHPIPVNYVPFEIRFTVTQILPSGESETPLSQKVVVTQHPGKYVTGTKSTGPGGGKNISPTTGKLLNVDFRFHSTLGISPMIGGTLKNQVNEVLYKITTYANSENEYIGDPTDSDGRTKTDEASNRLISPQFIIASHHGTSYSVAQYEGYTKPSWISFPWGTEPFSANYGSYNGSGLGFWPNISGYPTLNYNFIEDHWYVTPYNSAIDRCDNYFEGEYGEDGEKTEYYAAIPNTPDYRMERKIKKEFKYKGRWRIPTKAELELIGRIQKDQHSAVKYLLFGEKYFGARNDNKVYSLTKEEWYLHTEDDKPGIYVGNVRCVFDTYKFEDHQ